MLNSEYSHFFFSIILPLGFTKCSLFSWIIDERSIVDRPNHTQLCAFVVDSRCLRDSRSIGKWWPALIVAAAAAAVAVDVVAVFPTVIPTTGRSLPFSKFIILCLEAYTKHDTTNTTIAKQNVDSSTYIPISNAVVADAFCSDKMPLRFKCDSPSGFFSSFNGIPIRMSVNEFESWFVLRSRLPTPSFWNVSGLSGNSAVLKSTWTDANVEASGPCASLNVYARKRCESHYYTTVIGKIGMILLLLISRVYQIESQTFQQHNESRTCLLNWLLRLARQSSGNSNVTRNRSPLPSPTAITLG